MRRSRQMAAALYGLALLVLIGSGASAAAPPSLTPLGDLPGGILHSEALAVSADGSTVVGRATNASTQEGFRWTASGGMQSLGSYGTGFGGSVAADVNGDGSVVIGTVTSSGTQEAFRWTSADGVQRIGDLPGGPFESLGLGVSTDGSTVVGMSRPAEGHEAYRRTNSGGIQALGSTGDAGVAYAANSSGSTIVGVVAFYPSSVQQAFRWTGSGGMQGLGDISGGEFTSQAQSVSEDGSIVVGIGASDSGIEAAH